MSKGGQLRLQQVAPYVSYAMYSGDTTNPFASVDKRFALFFKQLSYAQHIDAEFEDMNAVMGYDSSQWVRRVYVKPPTPTLKQGE